MSKQLKAITIWQPYASLIVCGLKVFETRSWPTKYRGALIIHAAKRWDRNRNEDCVRVRDILRGCTLPAMTREQQRMGCDISYEDTLGCALGVVNLKDCRQMNDGGTDLENAVGYFGPDRYGWECDFPHVFDNPIPETGKQGLWTPSFDLEFQTRCLLGWETKE